jgi:hypothetical protein
MKKATLIAASLIAFSTPLLADPLFLAARSSREDAPANSRSASGRHLQQDASATTATAIHDFRSVA